MDRVEIKPFYDLSLDELYQLLELRGLVFVVGQKITSEPEIDGLDPRCAHALLWEEVDGNNRRLLATARLIVDQDPIVIGRVAVHPDFQRSGYGTALMLATQQYLDARPARLHAQAHLKTWYQGLGWRAEGAEFLEAGIPHISMRFDPAFRAD